MKDYWNPSLLKRFPSHEAALDRIAELEALRDESVSLPGSVLGLSPLQTRMVGLIALRGRVSYDQLLSFVWGADAPGENTYNLSRVHLSRARRVLAAHGITIKTEYGTGQYMDPASRERWRRAVAAARGEVADMFGPRDAEERQRETA